MQCLSLEQNASSVDLSVSVFLSLRCFYFEVRFPTNFLQSIHYDKLYTVFIKNEIFDAHCVRSEGLEMRPNLRETKNRNPGNYSVVR
jgi:hypothetical protein